MAHITSYMPTQNAANMMFPQGYGNGASWAMPQAVIQNVAAIEAPTMIVLVIPMTPVEMEMKNLKEMVLKFMNKDGHNL